MIIVLSSWNRIFQSVGMAYGNSICSTDKSVVSTSDSTAYLDANVFSHEVGHMLYLRHFWEKENGK